jgi:hypothetical protein
MILCRHYISPLNTFMRKGKDPDPDPAVPLTNGSGSGRPKNMRILRIRFRIRIPNLAFPLTIISPTEMFV